MERVRESIIEVREKVGTKVRIIFVFLLEVRLKKKPDIKVSS